jgi:hypothetical protein
MPELNASPLFVHHLVLLSLGACASKGYGSRSVCLSVCLSVTSLTATYFV